jgi:putative ABC transport system substrate-binding protein
VEDTKGSTLDLPARAAKLIAAKPDLLFTVTIPHTLAAKQSASVLPIVFTWVNDPIASGVTSHFPYSRSNLTGVASIIEILSGKRLEVLLEIAPKAKHLLVIVATNEPVSVSSMRSLEVAAQKFRVELVRRDATHRDEIIKALEETPRGSVDAIFFIPSLLVRTNLDLLVKRAGKDRIPLAVSEEAVMDSGALLSYGPNQRLVGLQAANLVQKILKGTNPGDIMIETPDRLFLAINQTTAKQIGMKIPPEMLRLADRVIQ